MREIGSKVVEKVENVSNAVICTISAIYGMRLVETGHSLFLEALC